MLGLTRRLAPWLPLVLIPLVLLVAQYRVAYWDDLEAFRRWSVGATSRTPGPERPGTVFRELYRDTDCNYPALGGLVTAGGMRLLSPLPTRLVRQVFRLGLALVEIANLALVLYILRRFAVPAAWGWTVAFALWPSTWAGGAVWGQIDVLTAAALLGAAALLVRTVLEADTSPRGDLAALAGAAACVGVAVQLKQLAVFSVPGLGLLAVLAIGTVQRRHGAPWRMAAALVPLAVVSGLVVGLDRLVFTPPPGHAGILTHVWTTGAYHVSYLSNNGPSVWTFLGRPNLSSSSAPFLGPLTPRVAGEAVYVVMMVLLGGALLATLWRLRSATGPPRAAAAAWCLWTAGLGNLLMGIVLTGTHERYLVHAFPFLFIGILSLRATRPPAHSAFWLVTLGVAALVYGIFVLHILYGEQRSVQASRAALALTAGLLAVTGIGFTLATLRELVADMRPTAAGPRPARARG